jgi:hypothetical protein
MWDGREVVPGATVAFELATQASDAVVGHAQGRPLTQAQRESTLMGRAAASRSSSRNRGGEEPRAFMCASGTHPLQVTFAA